LHCGPENPFLLTYELLPPFQVGFNAGNGTQAYEYKPYSQNMVIRDLANRGWANGFPGRHIFRVDEQILIGSCNKDIGTFDCMATLIDGPEI